MRARFRGVFLFSAPAFFILPLYSIQRLTSPRRLVERSHLIRLAQWRNPLKNKIFPAIAYLAEKAFKKLGSKSLVFSDAFSFLPNTIQWGGGRGKFFRLNGERTKQKQT